MGRLTSISRRDLIDRFRQLGFEGPHSGGRHQFMVCSSRRFILPTPYQSDIGVDLLSRILRQSGVSRKEWLGESDVE